ncbi:MAG TPA: hypothetical protein VLH56_15190, partial [Dissulfurispiraceae bacterium]|nr:hypothetical protein [Dissulfurispiraceae bacterium]
MPNKLTLIYLDNFSADRISAALFVNKSDKRLYTFPDQKGGNAVIRLPVRRIVIKPGIVISRLLKKSLCGSAGSISGDVLTWIDPSFSILEPLRESFLAVHFASRV